MECRFKFILFLLMAAAVASGCLSLRIEKADVGSARPGPSAQLKENSSSLGEALLAYGAPDEVIDMEGRIVLVYERCSYTGVQLSLGIPVSESIGPDVNMAGYGRLWKYDRLALFFSPNWVLTKSVFVKGSEDPFFKSLFEDKGPEGTGTSPGKQ
jgi:hypothetical protein